MPRLVECVPNFSEGRNRAVIDAIADAIRNVADVKLLDVDPGADTNRTVYTFVGTPEAVADAAVKSARRAHELIDMAKHAGAHPRIGALDVCPIVPISGVTMDDCVEIARGIGRRIGDELQVPVYFYEYAATSDARRSLATIRAGEYEGLERKLQDPAWAPDAGPARYGPVLFIQQARPGPGCIDNIKRAVLEVDIGIERPEMNGPREFPVFHGQQHLQKSGDACGRFQVADIGFNGTNPAAPGGGHCLPCILV